MATKLLHIPLDRIRENSEALRKVDRTKESYELLRDSIKDHGVMNAINVREVEDPVTKEIYYGLIDGLQRYTASVECNKQTIPAQVLPLAEADVLEAQIIANFHHIRTSPGEFTNALVAMMTRNPFITEAEMATKLNVGKKWLQDRLSLKDLEPSILALLDENKIPLMNAYALAKLPVDEQSEYVQAAMTTDAKQFAPLIQERAKELKEFKKQGKKPGGKEFTAVAHLRKMSELNDAIDKPEILAALFKKLNITSAVDGGVMALKWALNLDPVTIDLKKTEWEQEEAKKKAERDAKKAEADNLKKEEARQREAEIQNKLAQLKGGTEK